MNLLLGKILILVLATMKFMETLCTNDTLNIWCEMVSKIENEQRDGGQSPERSNAY